VTAFHFKRHADTGCWEWLGARDRGYGKVADSQTGEGRAHRAMWTEIVGAIPEGMTLDHLCHNRACVNPAHLEVVTFEENARRAVAYKHSADGRVCKAGAHPMTPENTTSDRRCRCCRRDYQREYQKSWYAKRAALKAAAS
jgi:hypothetical protein